MLSLKTSGIINPFPFVHKPFEIEIYLKDESDKLKSNEVVFMSVSSFLEGTLEKTGKNSNLYGIAQNSLQTVLAAIIHDIH